MFTEYFVNNQTTNLFLLGKITKTIPNFLHQIYYFCRAIGVLLLLQGRRSLTGKILNYHLRVGGSIPPVFASSKILILLNIEDVV